MHAGKIKFPFNITKNLEKRAIDFIQQMKLVITRIFDDVNFGSRTDIN